MVMEDERVDEIMLSVLSGQSDTMKAWLISDQDGNYFHFNDFWGDDDEGKFTQAASIYFDEEYCEEVLEWLREGGSDDTFVKTELEVRFKRE